MGDAVLLVQTDQVLEALPHRKVAVVFRVPIVVEFVSREDADLTCGAFDNAGVLDAIDGNTARTGKVVGNAIIPLAGPILLKPGDGEPGICVELTLDAAEIFVEFPIDDLKRGLHAHRAVIGFKNGFIA